MKLKTSEAKRQVLNYLVGRAEGRKPSCYTGTVRATAHPDFPDSPPIFGPELNYSTDWAQGGPIIEREWLDITPWPNESREDMRWHCQQHDTANDFAQYGPTLLIAAMRCYVACVLGDEVEVPNELIEVKTCS